MERQGDVAEIAASRHAARAAVDRRCDAAAVQEEDCAPAVLDETAERAEQRSRQRVALLPPEIDQPHARHGDADARREGRPPEPRPALGSRGGGPVDGNRAFERRALRRDRARVVPRVGLLLEGRVVLLVDDDQPDPAHAREDRRASPDDDPRLASGDAVALVAALRVAERRVEDRDDVSEPLPEAPDGLRRERDLGDEDDRPQAALERRGAGLEVDLGLAAAGRPLEEDVLADPLVERGDDPLDGRPLVGGERRRLRLARERLPDGRRRPLAARLPARRGDELERARRASSRSSRRARARGRRACREPRRAVPRRRPARRPAGAITPTSATTPRTERRPSRTETTAPLPVPSGTSYVNGRASDRVETSG